MPTVSFSPNIQSHVDVGSLDVAGETVRETLDSIFALHPRLRSYLFDDSGSVRKHIAMIVNGQPVADRKHLSDPAQSDDEIFVMQALSGNSWEQLTAHLPPVYCVRF